MWFEWVMAHIWMSHVTHMNESCHTYEWVMSRIWMSHVTHMNESCHTCKWVMSHTWMSHVTHVDESCHTRAWSCHTYESVMANIYWRFYIISQIPIKMIHHRNPPNPETPISRYSFKLNQNLNSNLPKSKFEFAKIWIWICQNLNLNLYHEIPSNLSFWIWWILVM